MALQRGGNARDARERLLSATGSAVEVEAPPEERKLQNTKPATPFQRRRWYRAVESTNLRAKKGQDSLKCLGRCLRELPDKLREPCTDASVCVAVVAALAYLVAIIWGMQYNLYTLEYTDASSGAVQQVNLLADCGSQAECLAQPDVCDYYGFACPAVVRNATTPAPIPIFNTTRRPRPSPRRLGEGISANSSTTAAPAPGSPNSTSASFQGATLQNFDLVPTVFVKAQWGVSWLTWIGVRLEMKSYEVMSLEYIGYFLLSSTVSYIFRHMDFLVMTDACDVLYSPFYSDAFIGAIPVFLLSCLVWAVLVMIVLKRVKQPDGDERLVARCGGGGLDEDNMVNSCSQCANITVWLAWAVFVVGAALWLGLENITRRAVLLVDEAEDSMGSGGASFSFSSQTIAWLDWLGPSLAQYFVPDWEWVTPFRVAGYLQNLLTVLDVCVILLQVLDDVAHCRKPWGKEKDGVPDQKQ